MYIFLKLNKIACYYYYYYCYYYYIAHYIKISMLL